MSNSQRISKSDRNRIKQARRFTHHVSREFDFSEADVAEVVRFHRSIQYSYFD